MKTSSGLHREGAKGMRRIVLVKDRVSMQSWGFAFVEFVDTQVRRFLFVLEGGRLLMGYVERERGVGCDYESADSPEWVPYIG